MSSNKRLHKALKQSLELRGHADLPANSKESLLGYFKLLIEMEQDSILANKVTKLNNNKE